MNETTRMDAAAGAVADRFRPAGAPPLVLASASAARAQLLRAAGIGFRVQVAAVDEAAVRDSLQAEGIAAGEAAVALAELKAIRVAARASPGAIVLGADQILTCGGDWLAKPEDLAEARAQLEQLAGRRHELWTAAVAFRDGARIWHHVAEARLWLRPLSPAFLDAYLSTAGEAVLGAVGAYQIEGPGAQLFSRIDGDHFAIQGLPLLPVLDLLRAQAVLVG